MMQLKIKIKAKCRIYDLKERIFFLFAEWWTSFVVKNTMYLKTFITHASKMQEVIWQTGWKKLESVFFPSFSLLFFATLISSLIEWGFGC